MKSPQKILQYGGIFLISLYLTFCFFKINGFFNNKKSEIIRSDGFGYYSFLPSIFIYDDYSQEFVKEKIHKYYIYAGTPEYMQVIGEKTVDKYFFGTAVLMYPFFMTAHWLALLFHQPADGYSLLYQYFMGLSALFYVFFGLLFCYKLLKLYKATVLQSTFICLLIAFATNLYYYTVVEPTMSHAYSFAAIAAFLFFSKSIFEDRKASCIIPAFIALGFIIIIRPFNVLILLAIPFLAGSFENLKNGFMFLFRNYKITSVAATISFLIVSLQFIIWHKQTGHYIVYSYSTERFYFDKPNIMNVLFSYRKGLFIYTPLCFISLLGFGFLNKKNKFAAMALLLFFGVLIYIMSCWHQWFYGASFGFRPMIEFYPLFALLILFSLQMLKKIRYSIPFILICILFLYVNQIQAYQYRTFILHWDNMTNFKYWKVFLKTEKAWMGYVWDNPEPAEIKGSPTLTFHNDFEKLQNNWDQRSLVNVSNKAHSGKMVTAVGDSLEFSNTLFINTASREISSGPLAITAFGFINAKGNNSYDKLKLAITYNHPNGEVYFSRYRPIDNISEDKNGWKSFELGAFLDKLQTDSDVVKIYFWSQDKNTVLIDDVVINIFTPNRAK